MQPSSAISLVTAALALSSSLLSAQQPGTYTPEAHPSLLSKQCSKYGGCVTESTSIVLDANWRWLHQVGDYKNCYTGNQWDTSLCSTPELCAKNCALEGADYPGTYGITTSADELQLKLITQTQYGKNVGSRVYLLDAGGSNYKQFKLLNQEFTLDVDVSKLPCGLNGALYFVQMDADGGSGRFPTNKAGAKYGTGYCDAQCPHDIKFINGEANTLDWGATSQNSGGGKYGACCAELDIWEANSMSNAFTTHPCTSEGQTRCSSPEECGNGNGNRYKGVCDKDGCDFNPFRMGNETFYGRGSQFTIDTTRKFTIVTQFITSDNTATGDLVEIRRLFKQDDRIVSMPYSTWSGLKKADSITDSMCDISKRIFGDENDHLAKGGLVRMGKQMAKGLTLAMSLWSDHSAYCLWLDSSYPPGADSSKPGVKRGLCPTSGGRPAEVEAQHPDADVKFMNIRVGDIGTTLLTSDKMKPGI
ncbi:RxLR-like protein [Plasmopara halstedii]|uniref:cellulose 1,4-beta-cellobiosidase (non-reducing end) n=1 Tax=Plasmopara halstedii TaxID=4781 RepID=A0A0P1AHL7_PLAHL|nr:RxLR-like protein [Plasmopara halstedii]CEG40366.1 RxLR-like protein [Plasmopara halstedii]|eukprot:XP_024576735.1 RxLR-like protein [Plasmopara halstedii]